MIENIRKYTGLMIVVLVLLFIGLVFMESSVQRGVSGAPAMEVAGKQISTKEFSRYAEGPLGIPGRLPLSFISEEAQNNPLTSLLGGNPASTSGQLLQFANIALESDRPERFLANRLAIQKAGLEYGATPGPEQVEAFIEYVLFADADGNFDQVAYDDFVKKNLGISIADFNHYIRDLLTAGNLAEIIGGGLTADPSIIQSLFRNGSQMIDVQQITLESAPYEKDQAPTDEEIKAYWEKNQETYNTEERRRISYTLIKPDWDAALNAAEEEKKAAEAAKKAQEAAAAKLQEEAKKAEEAANAENSTSEPTDPPAPAQPEGDQGNIGAQGEPAETPVASSLELTTSAPQPTEAPVTSVKKPTLPEPTAKEKLTPTQREKAVNALNPKANDFYAPLVDGRGNTFSEIAKKKELEVLTTELFNKSDAPKALQARILNSRNREISNLADLVFAIPAAAKGDQRITVPYPTTEGFFIAQLEEVEASRQLTFEEAKVKATVGLKKELARKQLAEETATIREKIDALISEGKSFEQAAKELELTFQKLPGLKASRFTPPAFDAARYTDPGTIAETKFLPNTEFPDRALILLVEGREVITDEAYKNGLQSTQDRQNLAIRLATFQSWLRDRYDENEVQYFGENQR